MNDPYDKFKNSAIQHFLQMAVPLRTLDMQANGGPSLEQLNRLREISQKPESPLFSENLLIQVKTGETAKAFNELSFCIAVLSFWPGGITLFGIHWETKPSLCDSPDIGEMVDKFGKEETKTGESHEGNT